MAHYEHRLRLQDDLSLQDYGSSRPAASVHMVTLHTFDVQLHQVKAWQFVLIQQGLNRGRTKAAIGHLLELPAPGFAITTCTTAARPQSAHPRSHQMTVPQTASPVCHKS